MVVPVMKWAIEQAVMEARGRLLMGKVDGGMGTGSVMMVNRRILSTT